MCFDALTFDVQKLTPGMNEGDFLYDSETMVVLQD